MRFLKWISMLAILAMLFALLPATVAEDEIAIETEEAADEALEIEVEGELEGETLEGLAAIDDPSLSLEDTDLALDGLADADLALDEPEESLLIPETEEQAETPVAANANGEFNIDEEGTLVRYGGFDKNVVIPDGVKRIGDSAFSNYSGLESVSIPDSVTSIDDYAFEYCTSLKSVNMPESITYIGGYAFSECTSLKSIDIPGGVTSIGSSAFSGCCSLTSIELPKSMTELSGSLFRDCDSLDNLDFLSGITEIGDYLFADCDGLKNITIPGSVTSIGNSAFKNCKNIESVTIHDNVSFIDRDAFKGNENVVIRGTIGSYAERYANGVGIPFNAPIVSINEKTYYVDKFNDEALILYINQNGTLNVDQKPADLARTLAWESSDTDVVTVDQNGKVTGISNGIATIIVNTADGKGRAGQIKVYVPESTEIWLDEDTEITLNKSINVSVYTNTPYQDDTGVEMPITWSSSDSSVISIEATDGERATLKGKKLGKATITATTPDGGKASMELEVVRPELEDFKIDQTGPITLHPGEQTKLTATLFPEGAMSTLTWESDDTSIATVSKDGMVTAIAEGEAWVNVFSESRIDGIEIYVVPIHPHPDSIIIEQSGPIKLYPGQKTTLTATLTPLDAEAKLTWHSDDKKAATVDQKGIITAVKEGWAYIYVETDNGCEDYIEVQVLTPPKKVNLSKTSATLAVGGTLTLRATVSPDDAETGFTWTSSNTAVATVSRAGRVTALKVGTAKITVKTDNGKTATATVTVKPVPRSVKLNQKKVTLVEKESLTLEAALSPSDACTTLTWTSSKPACATVSSKGVVTAKQTGATVITVKTDNGKVARATVIVKPLPRSVKLSQTRVILGVKEPLTLKATLTPTNAVTALTWTSSKPACATVSGNGVITAKQAGFTVITVKTDNGKVATASIIVRAAPEKVTLNKSGLVTLEKGRTLSLKATLPTNTASGLTWTSSKPGVASVDRNGKVTAKAKGITLITVRTFNGKTAKVTVKVQ